MAEPDCLCVKNRDIFAALRHPHYDCVAWLARHHAEVITTPTGALRDATPLLAAVEARSSACVSILLSTRSINVNAVPDGGQPALVAAAQRNACEIVAMLANAYGIDANLKEDRFPRYTAIIYAVQNGCGTCTRSLLCVPGVRLWIKGLCDEHQPLMFAASRGKPECVRALLRHPGIDVNARDERNRTALHAAAESGHIGCVNELLLAPGIRRSIEDHKGRTPWFLAARAGHADCRRAILGSIPFAEVMHMHITMRTEETADEIARRSRWGEYDGAFSVISSQRATRAPLIRLLVLASKRGSGEATQRDPILDAGRDEHDRPRCKRRMHANCL